MEPTKRELRHQKREIKRLGSQRRRRQLKRALAERPEDAPDAKSDFGRYSSDRFNGMDQDRTRRRPKPSDSSGGAEPH
jgi:hypothetical protein